jgi:uncharacterized protein YbjT (DUF2867 family)
MKIVVIGGSGLIGSKLVDRLRELDHTVLSAFPESGINTITNEGLQDALRDTDVVVDVSNAPSLEDKAAMDFFQTSTRNQLAADIYGDVKHHIVLSIVGADRLSESGYMRAKVVQENLIKESGIPYTILRSTQFFELADRIIQAATIGEEVHISPAAFQPIASDEVVSALTDLVLGTPLNTTVEVAGPVCIPMYEFIRYYLNEMEDSRRLVEDEHALYFGSTLNDESLLPGNNARLGKMQYEQWFLARLVNQ